MSVETHLDRALVRVRTEREAVAAKRDAFEAFVDRVTGFQTVPQTASTGVAGAGGTQLRTEGATDRQCRAVRTAFAETVRPHSVADAEGTEPVLATIRAEFTDAIAAGLDSTTRTTFTAELKRAVLAEATARRAEASALRRALDAEEAELQAATDAVADITDWVADADESPLTDLGFDALRRRHETLAAHRERCETLARDRQAFLRQTTPHGGAAISHHRLVPYCYQDFPVTHPVLSTVTRLDALCADCQRTVRAHLVRRA